MELSEPLEAFYVVCVLCVVVYFPWSQAMAAQRLDHRYVSVETAAMIHARVRTHTERDTYTSLAYALISGPRLILLVHNALT
jgi:hypothetical protein